MTPHGRVYHLGSIAGVDFRPHTIFASTLVQCTTCTTVLIDPKEIPWKKQQGSRVSTKPLFFWLQISLWFRIILQTNTELAPSKMCSPGLAFGWHLVQDECVRDWLIDWIYYLISLVYWAMTRNQKSMQTLQRQGVPTRKKSFLLRRSRMAQLLKRFKVAVALKAVGWPFMSQLLGFCWYSVLHLALPCPMGEMFPNIQPQEMKATHLWGTQQDHNLSPSEYHWRFSQQLEQNNVYQGSAFGDFWCSPGWRVS